MTATIVARRTSAGVKFTLCESIARMEAAYAAHDHGNCRRGCWPMADVYRAVGPLSLSEMADRTGLCERSIVRWMKTGAVPDRSADRLAIALDLHPSIVWTGYS